MSDDTRDDDEKTDGYERKGAAKPADELVGMVQEKLAEIAPDLKTPLTDDAFWSAKDAEVAAAREKEQAEQAAKWRESRAVVLACGGAPRLAIEIALGADFSRGTEAAAILDAWNGRGVITLAGGVGVGKTVAAVWWLAQRGGSAPAFIRATSLEAAGRYDKAMRDVWTKASALVLDDLGSEYADSKGNSMVVLDEIVDLFNSERRPLIVTTNTTAAAFKERYGERIASRVRQGNGWRVVGGRDLRSR